MDDIIGKWLDSNGIENAIRSIAPGQWGGHRPDTVSRFLPA
jgi:hypothetical protein